VTSTIPGTSRLVLQSFCCDIDGFGAVIELDDMGNQRGARVHLVRNKAVSPDFPDSG